MRTLQRMRPRRTPSRSGFAKTMAMSRFPRGALTGVPSALARRGAGSAVGRGHGRGRPRHPEYELHAADVERVAVGQRLLGDALSVDERAVLRPEILDRVAGWHSL